MNAKQRRFVDEYLIDLHAGHAAERAGYSPKTAYSVGQRLLTDRFPYVKSAVQAALDARGARMQVTQDRVLDELAVVSFSSVDDYTVDFDAREVRVKEGRRPDAIRAVSSVKFKHRVIPQKDDAPIIESEAEFKLWNKPETLRLTGQHLGMYIEKKEITLPQGGGVLMVPTPADPAAWAEQVRQRQAALATKPTLATPPVEHDG